MNTGVLQAWIVGNVVALASLLIALIVFHRSNVKRYQAEGEDRQEIKLKVGMLWDAYQKDQAAALLFAASQQEMKGNLATAAAAHLDIKVRLSAIEQWMLAVNGTLGGAHGD